MNRRQFIANASIMSATGFATPLLAAPLPQTGRLPQGPVTLYYEFRVAEPENEAVQSVVSEQGNALRQHAGFLSLSLKQMSGDSTMVKNYPAAYKGVLAEAYLDGVTQHTQPYFYALYIRFADYAALMDAQTDTWFDDTIVPHLHGYVPTPNGLVKTPTPVAHYRGVFQTIAAGNRDAILLKPADIISFLRHPAEIKDAQLVSVANHVMIADAGHESLEGQVVGLLKVAQETYQPKTDPQGLGQPGAKDNDFYRKAVTTEILRNAFADGELRSYLFHGVWQSVWDHENSHLDPRFKAAATPVVGAVVIGPVEPFYVARVTVAHA